MAPGVRSMILTKVQLLRLFVVFIPSASSGCCGARLGLNTCQRECQKDCQRECQNIWQKECKNRCQIECQNRCQIECQKERQIDCQSIYARKNVRTYMSYLHPNNILYVRNLVKNNCQGGDHSEVKSNLSCRIVAILVIPQVIPHVFPVTQRVCLNFQQDVPVGRSTAL